MLDGVRVALTRTRSAIRAAPVTTVIATLVVALTVLGALTGWHGIGSVRPFRAFAVTSGVLGLVTAVAGVIVLVGGSERLMGHWRTVAAFLITTVVGTTVGAFSAFIDTDHAPLWAVFGLRATSFDPWTAIVGTVVTASAFAGALWRRRIRVNAIAVCVALLLYAGHTVNLSASIAAVCGWGLGVAFRAGPGRSGWLRSSHRETRVLLGTVVLVSAAGPLLAVLSRAKDGLLAPLSVVLNDGPLSAIPACRIGGVTDLCARSIFNTAGHPHLPMFLSVAPLLALAVGGIGLFRGSRFAMWFVVVVEAGTSLATAAVFGLLTAAPLPRVESELARDQGFISLSIVLSVAVPLVTSALVVSRRAAFTVRVTRRRVATFAFTVLVSAAVLALVTGITARASAFDGLAAFRFALLSIAPVAPWARVGAGAGLSPALHTALLLAGPLLWIVVSVAALRAAGGGDRSDDVDGRGLVREQARSLLIAGGGDTFGWMTTWTGNEYWFSADGRAAVAYRRVGRVALTVGGPFGWEDARSDATVAFARHCDEHGLTPVWYGIGSEIAQPLQQTGWSTLPVAEDAVLDPRTWTTSGKRKQDIRTAVNRAQREGVTTVWAPWDLLDAGIRRQITAISEAWVADRELPEMGFTLGGLDEVRDPAVRVLAAVSATGTVLAVTSWLPDHRAGRVVGWTLDVMRRRHDAPNGAMEFLVSTIMEIARDSDVERVSLSAAPLAQADSAPAGGVQSLLELVGGVLEPVYGFRSLLRFKAKFGPEFQPLVLAYPDPVALPSIGIAVVRAYLPDLSLRQALAFVTGRRSGPPRH